MKNQENKECCDKFHKSKDSVKYYCDCSCPNPQAITLNGEKVLEIKDDELIKEKSSVVDGVTLVNGETIKITICPDCPFLSRCCEHNFFTRGDGYDVCQKCGYKKKSSYQTIKDKII